MSTDKRYPLCWPDGWPRTPQSKIKLSSFRVSQNRAQGKLFNELKLLGARNVYLSTNIKLRLDGRPYASQRAPDDKGVAVYFTYKDRDMVFACDKYNQIGDNIHAIGKTIEALRGIERWGASDMLERAFTGFEALPGPSAVGGDRWQDVLQVGNTYTIEECERNFKLLASEHHPDKGGDVDEFRKLTAARDQARAELS